MLPLPLIVQCDHFRLAISKALKVSINNLFYSSEVLAVGVAFA
jgi:hypothetical protein